MLDAPLVEMLKVMIICNKAKVNIDGENERKPINGAKPARRPSISTIAKPVVVKSHDDVEQGLEASLPQRQRSFRVAAASFGAAEDTITITGNPSETAMLRYCSRITSVTMGDSIFHFSTTIS